MNWEVADVAEPKRLADGRKAGWAFMDRFEVPDYDTDAAYLVRLRILESPWFGIYLHRFNLPDPRPTLHDHPWNFRSLVLRGGYVEATAYSAARTDSRPVNSDPAWPATTYGEHGAWRTLRKGSVNRKRAEDVHTIVHLLRVPTWTLMLVGRRRRVWGYLDRDGTWTAFDEHRHDGEFKAALARYKARRG